MRSCSSLRLDSADKLARVLDWPSLAAPDYILVRVGAERFIVAKRKAPFHDADTWEYASMSDRQRKYVHACEELLHYYGIDIED